MTAELFLACPSGVVGENDYEAVFPAIVRHLCTYAIGLSRVNLKLILDGAKPVIETHLKG
jgi:hypothetical protein